MRYFCRLDSSGNIEDTNLQLFSLRKASEEWNELLDQVEKEGIDNIFDLAERLSFLIICLGLSLYQLIGQNCPSPNDKDVGQPDKLLSDLMNRSTKDRVKKRRLNSTFREFLDYHGAIRHFGSTKDDKKYLLVSRLTLSEVNRFRKMTIEIWDLVIDMHRKDKKNNLEGISSIGEIVYFTEIHLT